MRNKQLAADRKAERKEAAAAKKKQVADQKKILSMSHKLMLLAPPQIEKYKKTEKIFEKYDIKDETKTTFGEVKDTIETWLSQAQQILKMAATSKAYDVGFESEKDISAKIKEGTTIVKQINTEKRALA